MVETGVIWACPLCGGLGFIWSNRLRDDLNLDDNWFPTASSCPLCEGAGTISQ